MINSKKKYLDYRNIGVQMVAFGLAQENGIIMFPVVLNWDYGTFSMIISKDNLIHHSSLICEFIASTEKMNLNNFTVDECVEILKNVIGCEEEYDLTKISDLV